MFVLPALVIDGFALFKVDAISLPHNMA